MHMPELPEVQTIVSDLKLILPGKKILSAVYQGELGRSLLAKSPTDLSIKLPGRKVVEVSRLAKQVVIEIDQAEYLIFHLKITGRLLLRDSDFADDEFTRLTINLDNKQQLRFTDRNGFADANIATQFQLDQLLGRYGPEVLDQGISPIKFQEILNESTEPSIKQTLLNQKIISGVGNIYADEALLLAKIHPRFKPKSLTLDAAKALLQATVQVLEEGLKDRGTTIDSYVDIYGNPGNHQPNLRAYGRSGKPCLICGTEIELTEVAGRRTYFCPNCQQLPQLSLF